jgi:uncharacterized protein
MMIVDLTTIKARQAVFDFSVEPTDIDLESESAKLISAAKVEANIKQGIVQTDVDGSVMTAVEVECNRCLGTVEKSLDFEFSAAFITPENYTQEREAEINASDLEISIFEGDKIDLTELVREQILLNLPEQVFCSEDCKGLCQKCGANRNLINCNCEEKEIDPRWAALKNLK